MADDGRTHRQGVCSLSPSPATCFIEACDRTGAISGSTTTQPDSLQFTPSAILYVNTKAAAGGDGSAAAPFQTIQAAVNHAAPGTQVLVADGTYAETVAFPGLRPANNWIQVKAAGSGAILDGSQGLTGQTWSTMSGVNKVWFLKLGRSIAYLARDDQRYYNYDSLAWLEKSLGHDGTSQMNEGWFYKSSTGKLYVRCLDNPANHSWQVPFLNHGFDVIGSDWIWIEGFEIRYYGTQLDGCGICPTNASHIVIRNNKIHGIELGIYFNWYGTDTQGNDTASRETKYTIRPLINGPGVQSKALPWREQASLFEVTLVQSSAAIQFITSITGFTPDHPPRSRIQMLLSTLTSTITTSTISETTDWSRKVPASTIVSETTPWTHHIPESPSAPLPRARHG